MKILLANYRYFVSSGPERYLFNVTGQLESRGHDVVPFSIRYAANVATPYERYFVAPLGGADEVYFNEHKRSATAAARTVSRLFYSREVERSVGSLVDDSGPDIAYVLYYLRKLSPSLLVGIRRRGVPIVARISDYGMFCAELHCLRDGQPCTECLGHTPLPSVRHGCVKGSRALSAAEAAARMFHRARGYFDLIDRFVVTNPFMLDMMVAAGFDRSRLVCIPTFTDTERFAPPALAGSRVADREYIVCVGRLDRPKGVHILLDALALLRSDGTQPPLLKIAGTGHDAAYLAALDEQIDRLELGDTIELLGHVPADDIPALLRGALAAVLPSLWFENLPNSLIESMASGTPVIASDIGSLAGEITNGTDGLLARPGDSRDLADRLRELVADPSRRDALGAAARRTALHRYDPGVHMDRLLEVFGEVVTAR